MSLGDVQGKGPRAATITALARYTVRAAAIQSPQPSSVMGLLKAALLRQGADRFCTMVYGRVAVGADGPVRVRLACGGHAPPLLVDEIVAFQRGRPRDDMAVVVLKALAA